MKKPKKMTAKKKQVESIHISELRRELAKVIGEREKLRLLIKSAMEDRERLVTQYSQLETHLRMIKDEKNRSENAHYYERNKLANELMQLRIDSKAACESIQRSMNQQLETAIRCASEDKEYAASRDKELEKYAALKSAVTEVVTQQADDLCWMDVYTKLGALVGVEINATNLEMLPTKQFLANCKRYEASLKNGTQYMPSKSYRRWWTRKSVQHIEPSTCAKLSLEVMREGVQAR